MTVKSNWIKKEGRLCPQLSEVGEFYVELLFSVHIFHSLIGHSIWWNLECYVAIKWYEKLISLNFFARRVFNHSFSTLISVTSLASFSFEGYTAVGSGHQDHLHGFKSIYLLSIKYRHNLNIFLKHWSIKLKGNFWSKRMNLITDFIKH